MASRLSTLLRWCVLALPLVTAQGSGRVSAQNVDEARLTAALISKFPEFVSWPPEVREAPSLVFCVTRRDPLEQHLRALVEGVRIDDRPLQVHVLEAAADTSRCHVLFVPADSLVEPSILLAGVAGRPVLTVGEHSQFLRDGGIITLHHVDGRLRFDANPDAARHAGLRLSSHLLRLAVRARGGRP